MRFTLIAMFNFLALASVAQADAERQEQTFPFRVERSAEVGQQIAGVKGSVIYNERSLGREAAFLTAPMSAGQWPINLRSDEPLFPILFKGSASLFYCPNRFKPAWHDTPETVCFRDSDKNGYFEAAAVGERERGFVFEISGHYIEMAMEDIAGSRVTRLRSPRAIAPVGYAVRQVRPLPGEEGLIEARYAGLDGGKPAFDISFRSAMSKRALYVARVTGKRRGAAFEATLPHPAIAYRFKQVRPRRIGLTGDPFPQIPNPVRPGDAEAASMTIAVATADAKYVSATIVRGFAAWSWYRQSCADDAGELVHKEPQGPLLFGYDDGLCEKTAWVEGGQWRIAGPETLNTGRLKK